MSKIIFLILFVFTCSLSAQNIESVFDCIYAAQGVQTIKLQSNWNKLVNQKMNEEYIPAKITMLCGTKTISYDVKIRARGNMRKQVCYYPPIKIDFKKDDLEKQKLDTAIDKLKVVFQCRSGDLNAELLMKEKLGYDVYRIVNPDFNVLYKVVKFECLDEDGKLKYTLDALILEDEGELSDRFNAKVIESGRIMSPSLEKDIYLRMVFFQYMIGNTDWSIPNKHNVEMIKVPGINKIVPIAYDFDYSALVGASYAVPHESLPIKTVEERYFMGHNITETDALNTAKYFLDKKEAIFQAVDACEGVADKSKNSIKRYFTSFYDMLSNDKVVKREFVKEN